MIDALDWLGTNHCDVVLADLGLPDSDGLSTLVHLRHAACEIPIVAMTGWEDTQFGIETIRAGADDVLPKTQLSAFMISRAIMHSLERIRAAERLRDKNRALKSKNRRLSAVYRTSHHLVNRISNEFRTPLQAIGEIASLLRDGYDGPVNTPTVQPIGTNYWQDE